MNKKGNIKLDLFNNSIIIREDENNMSEGVTVETAVLEGVFENIYLIPGVTFNDSYETRNGNTYVRKLGTINADVTDLCANSAATGYEGDSYISVPIDKKVSTKLGGCFTSKGFVSGSVYNLLKRDAGRALAEAWQNYVETEISTQGSAWNYTEADLEDARQMITDAKTEYKKLNKKAPNTLITSYDFVNKLESQFANGQNFTPAKNDEVLVSGNVGTLSGLLVIEGGDIEEPFYMYNWEVLHIPIAKDTMSDRVTGDNVDTSVNNSALQVIDKVNAEAGIKETFFHLNFGIKIVDPNQFLVATLAVAKKNNVEASK
ncbi:MAG: hypothetical protein ACK5HS_04550 [Mycoplasmatales bacterium]